MPPTAEASANTRDLSLDVAKGLGIILVVIGLSWRGQDSAGVISSPDLFRLIDTLIYNFHMPLFFLLSGMTHDALVLKRPAPEAALSHVTRLLWPLFLWAYIFVGARIAAGGAANPEVSGGQNPSSSTPSSAASAVPPGSASSQHRPYRRQEPPCPH